MSIFWLPPDKLIFPDPELSEDDGLLAIGGDLSAERLLLAYSLGIFPWFSEGDPILWWCPDPRFVLFPDELVVARSMRPYFNQRRFEVSFDRDFESVIHACAECYRPGQGGTWITAEMAAAYTHLHRLGYAHSVEVWREGRLAGGLYGISLGRCFFGESMFARESNASKYGFITLVQQLRARQFVLIDCQQETQHLGSLGARPVLRRQFLHLLAQHVHEPALQGSWSAWLS